MEKSNKREKIMKPKHPTAGRPKLENKAFLHRYKPEHHEEIKKFVKNINK